MAIYTIELDGKQYDIEGTKEPNEKEAREAISQFQSQKQSQEQPQQQPELNILGNLFNRPAAAVRGAIYNPEHPIKGYVEGTTKPTTIPTFQEKLLTEYYKETKPDLVGMAYGIIPSAIGVGADLITNPANLLMSLVGIRGAKKAASTEGIKIENTLQQTRNANSALKTLRNLIGGAKTTAIQEAKDIETGLNWANKSTKVAQQLQNPIYDIELLDKTNIIPKTTIGNLDKVQEALGDLISSPKIWEEAPKKELRMVKKLYGEVSSAMRTAAKSEGKPIDDVMNAYHEFMKRYPLVKKTITDSAGNAMANKLKKTFQWASEPAYKEAWKELSQMSPELKRVMSSMKNRVLLKNLLGLSVAGYALKKGVGVVSKFIP